MDIRKYIDVGGEPYKENFAIRVADSFVEGHG